MAKEIIYRCDKPGCNLTRPAISPTNHWFVVGPADDVKKGITIYPFCDAGEGFGDDKIFCGETHAIEYIAVQLRKFYPSKPVENLPKDGLSGSKFAPMP